MKELKLYRCPLCGNLFCVAEDSGVTPICCRVKICWRPTPIATCTVCGSKPHKRLKGGMLQ